MDLVNELTSDLNDTQKIEIDFGAAEVIMMPADSDQVEIKEFMNYSPSKRELTSLTKSGSTLMIREGDHASIHFSPFGQRRRVEIYLPEDYREKMDIEIGSGSLVIDMDLELTDFEMVLHSGKAEARKIDTKEADVELSSGKLIIDELTGKQKVEVSSGHLEIKAGDGNGEYRCSSGKSEIGVTDLTGDMDVEVTSGHCIVTLPDEAAFRFQSKVSSGSIHTYFDTDHKEDKYEEAEVGTDPSYEIKVDVSSGKADIERH